MRLVGIAVSLLLASAYAVADPIEPCEIDLGGPALPAYMCAEKQAQEAYVQLTAEASATLAMLPVKREPDGPYVTKKQFQRAQDKWLSHVTEHCQFVAQIPGEPGDWHIRWVYINSCMARESTGRIEQLKIWQACFTLEGGRCLP